MNKKSIFLLIIFFLNSCETNEDKKLFGQIIGAAVGGYVGSQFGSGIGNQITTALGVAVGAVIATKLVNILNEEDKDSFGNATIDSLENNPNNEKTQWESPTESNTSAEIIPLNSFEENGMPCRDFKQIVVKNGKKHIENATACRDESGNWKIV